MKRITSRGRAEIVVVALGVINLVLRAVRRHEVFLEFRVPCLYLGAHVHHSGDRVLPGNVG
jgi:hypothetical protein